MPNATGPRKDLGVRYTCFSCATKFYDLHRPVPTCPKCGADQREDPALKAPKPAPERPRKAPAKPRRARSSGFEEDELETGAAPAAEEDEDLDLEDVDDMDLEEEGEEESEGDDEELSD